MTYFVRPFFINVIYQLLERTRAKREDAQTARRMGGAPVTDDTSLQQQMSKSAREYIIVLMFLFTCKEASILLFTCCFLIHPHTLRSQ